MTRGAWGVAPASALVSAEVTTTLVVAHAAAGGALPAPGWVVAMAAAVFGAGLLVLRGSVRPLLALPALLAVQIGLHLWLGALAPGAHAGHAHGLPPGSTSAAGVGAVPDLHLGWPMLLAHLLGAVVTALAWHVRERTVERLLVWGRAVPRPISAAPGRPGRARRARPVVRLLLTHAPRRGPPVVVAAA